MSKRLENLTLFFMCLMRIASGFRAKKNIGEPKVALVAQPGRLGDMVCTTPMFKAIKNKYPQCQVLVMGNKINKELLNGNQNIDGYISFFGYWKEILIEIKKKNIDFACLAGPNFKMLGILYLAGVPLICAPRVVGGESPYESRFYKLLVRFVATEPHRMSHYTPQEYLRLLEPIGIIAKDTSKNLVFSKQAESKINDLFRANNFNSENDFIVGITPSAGNKIKEWPLDRFAKVITHLVFKYQAKIVLVGGPSDAELVTRTMELAEGLSVPKDSLLNAQGSLGLEELKALISKLKLFISVDTGPIYIAEAFNVATIDIVGPMDDKEQPPKSDIHRIVSARKEGQVPQLHIMNARIYDKIEARRQVEAITDLMVVSEVDNLMKVIRIHA